MGFRVEKRWPYARWARCVDCHLRWWVIGRLEPRSEVVVGIEPMERPVGWYDA